MMGLFSNIINKVGQSKIGQTIFKPQGIVDTITKPIQYFGAIVANPVTTIKEGPKADLTKAQTSSFESQAGKVLLNTGAVAAAVVTGGTSVGRSAAVKVGTAVIKNPVKAAVVSVAAPAVISAVVANPKIITEVSKVPSKAAAFGSDVGTFTKEPTLNNALNIVKENPLISTLIAGGAIAAGAGSIVTGIGALENIKTRESVQDLTKQLSAVPTAESVAVADTSKTITTTQTPFSPTTAITPATAPLPKTTTTRSLAKRKSKVKMPSINQRVNVIVQNKNTATGVKQSKNYLKRSILA